MGALKIVGISVVWSHYAFMIVTWFSKIGGVLKSTGNSTHDVFKLIRHASFSSEVILSIPLLLPCLKDVADVGMDNGNIPYTWDDVALIIWGVAVLEGATMEESTDGSEHELE